jgi:uncharacterized protein (TIGR03435 family)
MRLTSGLILALFLLYAAFAQPAAPTPAFDVASVKPSTPAGDTININLGGANHGIVTLTNTTLSECIRYAYGLASEDQISGPVWIRDRALRVDVTAKASPDTPVDQLLLMTQALLAERFHLTLHREPKPLAHLELEVGKTGSKLPASKGDTAAFAPTYMRGRLSYSHLTTHTLAVLLSRQLRQLVIDSTGLAGFFDVHLEWTPDDAVAGAAPDGSPQPDIFGAVQQQLGLRLEVKKTPVEILVVDHAEKVPTEN